MTVLTRVNSIATKGHAQFLATLIALSLCCPQSLMAQESVYGSDDCPDLKLLALKNTANARWNGIEKNLILFQGYLKQYEAMLKERSDSETLHRIIMISAASISIGAFLGSAGGVAMIGTAIGTSKNLEPNDIVTLRAVVSSTLGVLQLKQLQTVLEDRYPIAVTFQTTSGLARMSSELQTDFQDRRYDDSLESFRKVNAEYDEGITRLSKKAADYQREFDQRRVEINDYLTKETRRATTDREYGSAIAKKNEMLDELYRFQIELNKNLLQSQIQLLFHQLDYLDRFLGQLNSRCKEARRRTIELNKKAMTDESLKSISPTHKQDSTRSTSSSTKSLRGD